MNQTRRAFLEKLANRNKEFYGSPDGRGVLRPFGLAFDHSWTYLSELIQNALDAKARSIALRFADDGIGLVLQHDGRQLRKKDVKALSKAYRSTKGASATGFMGVGFKSIFGRFREVRISGWGWQFRYEVTHVRGERYGDMQPDLLGAVVPIWDKTIAKPDPEFTTRFEMRRLLDNGSDPRDDLDHLLPDDDRTPLAMLAVAGLEHFEVDGHVWDLRVREESDGTLEVRALSEGEALHWRLFPCDFTPSDKAIARFLEHRCIQPTEDERDRVYTEVGEPRQVMGILPLDDKGKPTPPAKGRIYATLPTDVFLPLRLHINADWLLNISRGGLKDIEDNAWQLELADRIADVLASFMRWTARSFLDPADAEAAFAVLVPPSDNARGLEALLAEDRWLARFRMLLEDAAVMPVWSESSSGLTFSRAADVVVPPSELAQTFRKWPELRPAVLLKGPVLMEQVLGLAGYGLLMKTGLLGQMLPEDLAKRWSDGLETWWTTTSGDTEGPCLLLFRLWAAVAKLTSRQAWQEVELPCVRTASGQWRSVSKVNYFKEQFPSEREPGGSEVFRFMRPFIRDEERLPDGWIAVLDSSARQENQEGASEPSLSLAKDWIEKCAQRVSLLNVVAEAIAHERESPTPDWSILISLGHWAKHRNRPDLLIWVLVDTPDGANGVPVNEALLADPYVDANQGRCLLFPKSLPISPDYMEQHPTSKGEPEEWRLFLEEAGIKGKLKVVPTRRHASRYQPQQVADFLCCEVEEIGMSNNAGYELLDFDFQAELPVHDASKERRSTLAAWLEDGHQALRDTGRRRAKYRYSKPYEIKGKPSAWMVKISQLAWVPCNDGQVRCPRDVLGVPDPAREDAPFAELSEKLLATLQQEGVRFGTEILEATVLVKLSARGSHLGAEDFAELLRECREEAATSNEREQFTQIMQTLTIPTSNNGRIPLGRIVQRISGRGALGGWVAPLEQVDEVLRTELEHEDFPYNFPETTTGEQALSFLRDTWRRARMSYEGLASEVRDVLPVAYAYCLKDCAENASLAEKWREAKREATVFAEGKWIVLHGIDDIYFDDLGDRRFFPQNLSLRTATAGHLGRSSVEQKRTVEALGLRCLSSLVIKRWQGEDDTRHVPQNWIDAFDLIYRLLRSVRGNEREEIDEDPKSGHDLELVYVGKLTLEVSIKGAPPELVPVNARLYEGALTLAGRPVEFSADAAKELLRHFSFRQRGNLAADLTGMLSAIDNPDDFHLAADKFRRAFAPEFDLSQAKQSEEELARIPPPTAGPDKIEARSEAPATDGPLREVRSTPPISIPAEEQHSTQDDAPNSKASFTKDRALAVQNALAKDWEGSLKGELVPRRLKHNKYEAASSATNSAGLGDEDYREAAMQYERKFGRKPELGHSLQKGWDIRSMDPYTGETRLIEVKGKGALWIEEEVIELSQAQIRKALQTWDESDSEGQAKKTWYLYVVEKAGDSYKVLPIPNPVKKAAKWMLCGRLWRVAAEFENQCDEVAWRERVKGDLAEQVEAGGKLYGHREDGAFVERSKSGDQIIAPAPANR